MTASLNSQTLAAVINVDTYPVTALAVLSMKRYSNLPILLIDCSQNSKQQAAVHDLAKYLGTGFENRALKSHGLTLDDLFRGTDYQRLLLVDSDAELLDDKVLQLMHDGCTQEKSFGAGFSSEGHWLHKLDIPYGWYAARMWIPFCMFNTQPVKQVISDGCSFEHNEIYNDLPNFPLLSKYLYKRYKLPGGRFLMWNFLNRFRKEYDGVKPSAINFDTGANIYRQLITQGYSFHQLDWNIQQQSVAHYHGVTRRRLNWFDHNAAKHRHAFAHARDRIRRLYANELPDHLLP